MADVMTATMKSAEAADGRVRDRLLEAVFPITRDSTSRGGEVATFPKQCSTCGGVLDPRTAAFELDPYAIGPTWKITAAYDLKECVPENRREAAADWDGSHWTSWSSIDGAPMRDQGHPMSLRELTLAERAAMLLEADSVNAEIMKVINAAFDYPEAYYDETMQRAVFRGATLVFADGRSTSLDALVQGHRDELCVALVGEAPTGTPLINYTYRPIDLYLWMKEFANADAR